MILHVPYMTEWNSKTLTITRKYTSIYAYSGHRSIAIDNIGYLCFEFCEVFHISSKHGDNFLAAIIFSAFKKPLHDFEIDIFGKMSFEIERRIPGPNGVFIGRHGLSFP